MEQIKYFPSYKQIQFNILASLQAQHEKKKVCLQESIQKLNDQLKLEEQHQKIKEKLLQNYSLSKMVQVQSDLKKQKISKDPNFYQTTIKTDNYSLNYCIDDDIQQQNHYQNHLKFKKQVLERDLFQTHIKKGIQKFQQQQVFKNLYQKGDQQNKKKKKKNDHQKIEKQQFSNKRQKHIYQRPSNIQKNLGQKAQIWHKNAKILKDNYSSYIKQLMDTNIIKYRVING